MRRWRRLLTLFLAAATLGACAQTRLGADAVQWAGLGRVQAGTVPQPLSGLRAQAARLNGAEGQLRLLVVNGMATDAHGYSFDLQRKIATELGAGSCIADRAVELTRPIFVLGPLDEHEAQFQPATLRITDWAPRPGGVPRVIFYELLWTPYADELADRYLGATALPPAAPDKSWNPCSPKPRAAARRARLPDDDYLRRIALLNRAVKDEVMIGGLTDAVLSVGPLGTAARDAIRQSFCIMAADALEEPRTDTYSGRRCRLRPEMLGRFSNVATIAGHLAGHEFAVIAYSLGSFMVLDAIDELRLSPGDFGLTAEGCQLLPPIFDGMPVYLFSNQIALLMTARPHFGCDPESTCTLVSELGGRRFILPDSRLRSSLAESTDDRDVTPACRQRLGMDLIAFNDPNDIMGYRLPDFLAGMPLFRNVVNVRVRNPGFRIPGILANPFAAHTNHGRNPAVVHFMLEGWP